MSVMLSGVIDGVAGNLDHKVLFRDFNLAREPGLRGEPPGPIEEILFVFLCGL
jgi:hypothetical protein